MQRLTNHDIGRLAERQPGLLNPLVAYFVLEWQAVNLSTGYGIDQVGDVAAIPNYVRMWSLDTCVHYLLASPRVRDKGEPGFISTWLQF